MTYMCLPPELRQMIYRNLVDPDDQYASRRRHGVDALKVRYHLNILRTSQAIYDDAYSTICEGIGPIITATIPYFNYKSLRKYIPLYPSKYPEAIRRKNLHIDINKSDRKFSKCPRTAKIAEFEKQHVVIVGWENIEFFAYFLPRLPQTIRLRFPPNTVSEGNPYPSIDQNDLMRLLVAVQNPYGLITVEGATDEYCGTFTEFIRESTIWTTGLCIQQLRICARILDGANKLSERQNFDHAVMELTRVMALLGLEHDSRSGAYIDKMRDRLKFNVLHNRLLCSIHRHLIRQKPNHGHQMPNDLERLEGRLGPTLDCDWIDQDPSNPARASFCWLLGILKLLTGKRKDLVLARLESACKYNTTIGKDTSDFEATLEMVRNRYTENMSISDELRELVLSKIPSPVPADLFLPVDPSFIHKISNEYYILQKVGYRRLDKYAEMIRITKFGGILGSEADLKVCDDIVEFIEVERSLRLHPGGYRVITVGGTRNLVKVYTFCSRHRNCRCSKGPHELDYPPSDSQGS
ncbi:hypothetical protein TWF281_007838 [Arthrobotrys megalospora]